MKAVTLSLLMLASWLPTSASATDVYKWLDENGTPNYSERPPEGVDYIKVKIYGAANTSKSGSYYSIPKIAPKPSDDKPEADSAEIKKTTP